MILLVNMVLLVYKYFKYLFLWGSGGLDGGGINAEEGNTDSDHNDRFELISNMVVWNEILPKVHLQW